MYASKTQRCVRAVGRGGPVHSVLRVGVLGWLSSMVLHNQPAKSTSSTSDLLMNVWLWKTNKEKTNDCAARIKINTEVSLSVCYLHISITTNVIKFKLLRCKSNIEKVFDKKIGHWTTDKFLKLFGGALCDDGTKVIFLNLTCILVDWHKTKSSIQTPSLTESSRHLVVNTSDLDIARVQIRHVLHMKKANARNSSHPNFPFMSVNAQISSIHSKLCQLYRSHGNYILNWEQPFNDVTDDILKRSRCSFTSTAPVRIDIKQPGCQSIR